MSGRARGGSGFHTERPSSAPIPRRMERGKLFLDVGDDRDGERERWGQEEEEEERMV